MGKNRRATQLAKAAKESITTSEDGMNQDGGAVVAAIIFPKSDSKKRTKTKVLFMKNGCHHVHLYYR